MGPKSKLKKKKKKDVKEENKEENEKNNQEGNQEESNNGGGIFGNSPEIEFTAVISVPPQVVLGVRRRPLWLFFIIFNLLSCLWFMLI